MVKVRSCSFHWLTLLIATALVSACSFDANFPSSRIITCSSASPACPSGYTCRTNIGRCVTAAEVNLPAPTISNVVLAPTIGNLQTNFALTFEVSADLARAPTAYATSFGDAVQTFPFLCSTCAPGQTCSCSYSPEQGTAPSEGPLRVWVELIDAFGNEPPPLSVGNLEIDATPPSLAHPATLTLEPPANITTPVTELGPGGEAEVCFTVDEPLGVVPLVWAADSNDAGALDFALESGYPLGLRYCHLGGLAGPISDGAKTIRARLQDLAGNVAQVVLVDADGGLAVDATPPDAPDVSVDGGLLFHRAPWGELPDLQTPHFTLSSSSAAISEVGTLLVYEDQARLREVAQVPVTQGALAPVELSGPDRRALYVDLVDRAGNYATGGPFLVRNEEWVATLGGKIAGQTLANPNDCYARPVFAPTLLQGDDAANDLNAPVPDAGPLLIGGAATWRERFSGAPDVPDYESDGELTALTAYDSARGRVVSVLTPIFPDSPMETWEYDGDWHQRISVGSRPSYRIGSGLSYDARRGRTVLFGGHDSIDDVVDCDTWEWDGNVWREILPCTMLTNGSPSDPLQPTPRGQHAQAYDRRRQRTVILGGSTESGTTLEDMWEYDGQRWTSLPTDAGMPSPKEGASMDYTAFPDGGSALVLVGGATSLGSPPGNDTWFGIWNGQTYAWTLAFPSTCANETPDCFQVSVVGDPWGTSNIFLASYGNGTSVRLWRWNTTGRWFLRATITSDALNGFRATPGALDGTAYLVSGEISAGGQFQDWRFNAGFVSQTGHSGLSVTPPALQVASLAFDGSGNGVLFGGMDSSSNVSGNAYLWNGNDWTGPLSFSGASPPARLAAAMAFNPDDGRFWIAGGTGATSFLNDIWALDLNQGWSHLGDVALDNSASASLAFVPDAGMVLAGADLVSGDDTVLLVSNADGGVKPDVLGPQPDALSISYDVGRSRLVGIAQTGGQIYEVAGDGGWVRTLRSNPPLKFPFALYDSDASRMLFVSESVADPVPGDVWIYDGATTIRVPMADPEGDGAPSNEFSAEAPAFNPSSGTLLTYGGEEGLNTATNQTWELSQANHSPGMACQFRFDMAEAGDGAQILGVRVDASGGADPAGAQLELWEAGHWVSVANCGSACPAATPTALSFETGDPAQTSLLLSDLDTLGAAVVSSAQNGNGLAKLSSGAMQVTVRYRLP
jgi:hypothetical protein